MIKRDTIQRCIITTTDDGQGGYEIERELKEIVQACVSQTTTYKQLTEFSIKEQIVLNVVTNIKLDENVKSRYIYGDKLFRVMRQVKSGNEYFSVLVETNE